MKRTYNWEDPLESVKEGLLLSGLDYMESMHKGSLPVPPILKTIDFKIQNVEKANISFEFIPQTFHYNPIGSVHGGVITTVLDSAIGCTIHSMLAKGYGYTTVEIKVNFIKKITIETGKMITDCKIIHKGRTTALVEASLKDKQGKIYAHAVSTCMIFKI
ncbi:PaaI family thioesterase [Tenacibaculum sp. IB213877]|uniref:PaaI family thioesterase n=1 Tax=Tenacibaculum sp. IB213877 TaxID=3097351 RepID=UPI002A5B0748|nr:PaaI family thioesterase [Tenacibaculum sp. IB213877]MDY0779835.1 PaaI family thioesterase [Tenacibaculum sp. IB213877]